MSTNILRKKPMLSSKQQFAFTKIRRGKKVPTCQGWNLRENAIYSNEAGNHFTDFNVGLLHVYCSPNTCALDVDKTTQAEAVLSREAGLDLQALLTDSKIARISSGRPDSDKVIFRLPDQQQCLVTKVIKNCNDETVFELRCADTKGNSVCDVIPPSIHPSGTQYNWVNRVGLNELTEIPPDLLNFWLCLIDKEETFKAQRNFKVSYRDEETPRRIALLEQMLEFISADCSRDKWKRIVFSIMSSGYSVAEQIAYDWSITSDRYTDDDFWHLIRDYDAEAVGVDGAISLGTIYFHAKQGGWHG